ncbi:hypothetical protein [Nannocystis pusilla]|uniref:hypothetical protein n=1 Tax=Nannocystis pusilla TaxID=889268 RepID=UPI003BEFDF1A
MRNTLSVLAGIALLVGAVAPEVHAGGSEDSYPTYPTYPTYPPYPPPEPVCEPTEGSCPDHFELVSIDAETAQFDDDGDDCVCVKEVPGEGNVGDGRVAKDDD